jgi:hypothetical protein
MVVSPTNAGITHEGRHLASTPAPPPLPNSHNLIQLEYYILARLVLSSHHHAALNKGALVVT